VFAEEGREKAKREILSGIPESRKGEIRHRNLPATAIGRQKKE